jgi:hypothetical protein
MKLSGRGSGQPAKSLRDARRKSKVGSVTISNATERTLQRSLKGVEILMENDDLIRAKFAEILKEGNYTGIEKDHVLPIALAYSRLTKRERQLFHSSIEIMETYRE